MPRGFPIDDLLAPGKQHMSADRSTHREEQGQDGEAIKIVVRRAREIAVEHRVRGRLIVEMNQIHQREREIVKNIRGRDDWIEFDGIEQPRRSVNQGNIGQMKIAVAVPHEPLAGTPPE